MCVGERKREGERRREGGREGGREGRGGRVINGLVLNNNIIVIVK